MKRKGRFIPVLTLTDLPKAPRFVRDASIKSYMLRTTCKRDLALISPEHKYDLA